MTRCLTHLRPWHSVLPLHRGLLLAAACCGVFHGDALAQAPQQTAAGSSSQVQVALAEMPSDSSRAGSVHRDSQVVPAGAHFLHKQRRVCPQGGCNLGAKCQGTCVVRPSRFGYYATEWRTWPGDAVQQTSHEEMTPVSPPASAVPSPDEEALMPSSLLPDEDTSFGSDNFGFEPVEPAPPTPQLPPPAEPGAGDLPPAPPATEADTPQPAPSKPSLFDPPGQPEAPPKGDMPEEKKPDESLDNLFDDFGRASQSRGGSLLRQRVAMANQQAARRQAEKSAAPPRVAANPKRDAWQPRQLPNATASTKPLVKARTAAEPSRVVPAAASEPRPSPRSNPLR